MSIHPNARREFWAGVRNTIPMDVGAIPFGIIFGVVGSTSGLTPAATMGMSLFVFAGSSQFIAAGMVAQGAAASFIILTTFVVNLRHALYGATLSPHVKHLPQRWLIPLGFWLTDETFAVTAARYNTPDESPYRHWFILGSSLAMYLNWQITTLIGVLGGRAIPNAAALGLDFAMVVTFIGLVVPLLVTRPAIFSVLVAGVVAILTYSMPNKIGLIIAALAGVIAGVAAEAVFGAPSDPLDPQPEAP